MYVGQLRCLYQYHVFCFCFFLFFYIFAASPPFTLHSHDYNVVLRQCFRAEESDEEFFEKKKNPKKKKIPMKNSSLEKNKNKKKIPEKKKNTPHKPLRVTRTGLMNKVTPSQPERDSIDQTPNEKETCSMAKEKK